MLIAKTLVAHGPAAFMEVLRENARVQFDARDGWMLVAKPLDRRPRHRELMWIHPDDLRLDWIREFRFKDT